MYACAASPRGFDALCVIGTGRGLLAIDLAALTDRSRFPQVVFGSHVANETKTALSRHQVIRPPGVSSRTAAEPNMVTSVDFVDGHPHLVLAAGRRPDPWLADMREDGRAALRSMFTGGSRAAALSPGEAAEDVVNMTGGGDGGGRATTNAVAHVRSAGPYHVVAAGLRDTMLLYDLRYIRRRRGAVHGVHGAQSHAGEPLLQFADYHNDVRLIGLGFAVDAGLGLVAAAEDHKAYTRLKGGFSLFSLATGERLGAPGLCQFSHHTDTIVHTYRPPAQPDPDLVAFTASQSPLPHLTRLAPPHMLLPPRPLPHVAALSFASLPGERGTSLFVGGHAYVHKFSLSRGGAGSISTIPEDVFMAEDRDEVKRQQALDEWHRYEDIMGG